MAKNKTIFVCSECGNESSKWLGKCPACQAWNSFYEQKIVESKNSSLKAEKVGSNMPQKLNTYEAKASQFNHFDKTYTKKTLSQRWNDFNGIKIQRDLYSAFLIMNINDDLKSFDIDKCNERFENFYRLHNLEVDRLKGHKNLSSIAI